MAKKGNIACYRERLDETLASENLVNEGILKTLVTDQIIRSSESKSGDYTDNIIDKRVPELSNFLEMLRSASEKYKSHETRHASWKLKQDAEEFRVMYREGPLGSPFHTLLVDGYVEAPLDVCLCVSWESVLYPRWFPEIFFPSFKMVEAKSLKKIRIGEQLSLFRLKVPWPLSNREALLHYFEFEYLQDDLVVVLLNTIPDVSNIHMETHGFTNKGIPSADNAVRIDVVGGYALQKVTDNKSYFRLIGNLDLKVDFVPSALINFISRQLIGSAFRLYQKTVASVCNGDEAFGKALKGPLYSRKRQAYLNKKTNVLNVSRKEDLKVLGNGHVNNISEEYNPISNEIEEEVIEESNGDLNRLLQHKPDSEIEKEIKESAIGEVNKLEEAKESCSSSNQPELVYIHNDVPISPQVERALGFLDKTMDVDKERKYSKARFPINITSLTNRKD